MICLSFLTPLAESNKFFFASHSQGQQLNFPVHWISESQSKNKIKAQSFIAISNFIKNLLSLFQKIKPFLGFSHGFDTSTGCRFRGSSRHRKRATIKLLLKCLTKFFFGLLSLSSTTMAAFQAIFQYPYFSSSSTLTSRSFFSIPSLPSCIYVKPTITCFSPSSTSLSSSGVTDRTEIRLGLPSKGRMAEETKELLEDCQLPVKQVNPRQYIAWIPQLSNLEVWAQRPKDIVRKLLSGDLDLGIVGLDTLAEYGQGNEDLILVHNALEYGDCHLSLAIPKYGIFENINSVSELAQMPRWTKEKPLRVATGFSYLGPKFMKENGFEHVTFSTADGALEAAPAMGIADAIVDLVSSGTTLRENNLKEIEGGVILESQAVLVASRKSLIKRGGVLDTTHEILERLEAHLRATGQFTVVANMRGSSAEEIAERILTQPSLSGLQGPTISPVFCKSDGKVSADYYAIVICVPKKALYKSVQQLRAIGGSGVLVSPLTYIFDEETPRWRDLLLTLGL